MPTTARLEARLPEHVLDLLKEAASLQGRTLTDFVVGAAHDAARKVVTEMQTIKLTREEQIRFAEALLAPPRDVPKLREALERHKAEVEMR